MQMSIEISQVQPHNYNDTEDAFDAEKAPSNRKSKLKRRRTSRTKMPATPDTNQYCLAITPESATSQLTQIQSSQLTPICYDINVPGLPYRSPSYHATNLELAQFAQYQMLLDNSAMEVYQI